MDWQTIQSEICGGIETELTEGSKYAEFVVTGCEMEGNLWKVFIDLSKETRGGLDERFEASFAWWAGPPQGRAEVLSVNAETEQINLRFASCPPPERGGKIRIYPPRYLEALLDSWRVNDRARIALNWLCEMEGPNTLDSARMVSPAPFLHWLRKRQAMAFRLPGWRTSFLWGPPGTGKTMTLGAILAYYLVQFPSSRILLFSTTNAAVDQALVGADKSLEELSQKFPAAPEARRRCFRVGNHFIASSYEGRRHLLPISDESLIAELVQLEGQRPDPQNTRAYAAWKQRAESIRAAARGGTFRVLQNARLAALTTTHAVFALSELLNRAPYDLVVFDEASQIGMAYALMIGALGRRTLFAGDPKQLAPVVQSGNQGARCWLGRSAFAYMKESAESTVLLNEQSRMAEPICSVISNVFYESQLVLANDLRHNKGWKRYRQPVAIGRMGSANTFVQNIADEGIWSRKYHGPIRYGSAGLVRDLVYELKTFHKEKDILVLTPFRSQSTLIRALLRKAHCSRVTVSTVHRAQGSERHTVIFDPVEGQNQFLNTEEAHRLINVALSRAQARLVLLLSTGDRKNPLLSQIASLIESADVVRLEPLVAPASEALHLEGT